MKSKRNPSIQTSTTALAVAFCLTPFVHASTWVGDTSQDWNTATN